MTSTFAIPFPQSQSVDFTAAYSRLVGCSSNAGLREIKRNFVGVASRVVTNLVSGSCAVEPVASWRNTFEPTVSTLAGVQAVYNLYAERDGLVLLDDEDLPLPSYCQRAVEALEYYDGLADDWDESGALAPQANSTHDARYFLRVLSNQIVDIPTVRPMIDAEGIPGFFWSDEVKYLSISFYGDFSLTFFFRNKSEGDFVSRTISLDDAGQIADLLALIEAI